jgi:hypothetical protein
LLLGALWLALGLDLLLGKLLLWHGILDLCLRRSSKRHTLHPRYHRSDRGCSRTRSRGVRIIDVALRVWTADLRDLVRKWLHLYLRLLRRRRLHRLWQIARLGRLIRRQLCVLLR